MTADELQQVILSLNAEDAFRPRLDVSQWRTFLQFLTRHEVRANDLLLKQGELDRTVYFLGQGSLQVYATGGPPGTAPTTGGRRLSAAVRQPGRPRHQPSLTSPPAQIDT